MNPKNKILQVLMLYFEANKISYNAFHTSLFILFIGIIDNYIAKIPTNSELQFIISMALILFSFSFSIIASRKTKKYIECNTLDLRKNPETKPDNVLRL